jgi:acyl-CoA reductase-like NAD-dependent aldehyde dehydrogenase
MFSNIINSERRGGGSAAARAIDPRTKKELWDVPVADEKDLNDAVLAAREAFKSWKLTSADDRQKCLFRLADELETRRGEMCPVLAKETGKSVWIGPRRSHIDSSLTSRLTH